MKKQDATILADGIVQTLFGKDTVKEYRKVIDDYAVLNARFKPLKKQREALLEKIKPLGDGSYDGDKFTATIATSYRSALDAEAVREKLGAKWCAEHTVQVPVVTVTTQRK